MHTNSPWNLAFIHVSYVSAKVKASLCFNWAPRHEGVLGSGGIAPRIFNFGTRWRCVVSFTPGRFTPRESDPGTHRIGGWVGPRAVLNAVVKRKIPSPHRESNPRTPIIQPVTQCYTDWARLSKCFCTLKNNEYPIHGNCCVIFKYPVWINSSKTKIEMPWPTPN
jgi:hypothetical protein